MNKFCPKCKQEKPFSEFYKQKLGKFGLRAICIFCINNLQKEYREKHKKQISDYQKNHYQENKELKKLYQLKNKKHITEVQRKWKNSTAGKNSINNFYKNNPEYKKFYINKRYNSDINFKIIIQLRTRFFKALKNDQKSGKILDLLGCTIPELKIHLEKQFTEGMNWQNNTLKGWHIDHIKPCASFDLSKPENQKECFHYTNLRPLWAKDNLTREKFKRIKQNDKAIFL
jgi:hypothetical protein